MTETTIPETSPWRKRAVLHATVASACIAMSVAWWVVIRPADDAPIATDTLERTVDAPAKIGERAPSVVFDGLNGPDIAISDLLGRVVVVNFWASTCAPCVKEMPLLEEVANDRADVTFIGVSVTESVEAGSVMVERTGVTFDQGRDPNGEHLAAFGGIALPHTVVIDANGVVKALANRAIRDRSDLEELIDRAGP